MGESPNYSSLPPLRNMSQDEWEQRKRFFKLFAAVAVAAALIGLIVGIREPVPFQRAAPLKATKGDVALSYTQLREGRRGENREIYRDAFSRLRAAGPGLIDPVEQSEKMRSNALERRSLRRAFAGAPPTIPHAVQEQDPTACMACHDKGAQIAGLRAPAMSHAPYSMCTQCHAMGKTENAFVASRVGASKEDSFEGLKEPNGGERAAPGAPPTVPHPTFMRENCSSCHGTQGALGMRSTHPARVNCEQCHAPAAKYDGGGPPVFGVWPPQ